MEEIVLKGKIRGYESGNFSVTETGDIRLSVDVHGLQEGDIIESTSIEFGVLKRATVIRPFSKVDIVPICLAAAV